MEPIMLLWIAMWGLLPPIAVGYYSFRQGRKGREDAMKLRDEALATVGEVRNEIVVMGNNVVRNILSELQGQEYKIPEDQMKAILDKVQKSVSGTYGNLIKGCKATVDGELDELAGDLREEMSPEQTQALMGQKIQGALMKKVMSFFE